MITADHLRYISELIDEIALEKPLDWEVFNYETVKETAIQGAIEMYMDVINNTDMTEEDRGMSYLATVAYLMMENTMLHIENQRYRNKYGMIG